MHTIKLVVIGASGVGKTSLRGQYISSRFTSGYRATIGTDFIAKTLPHPMKSEQNVTLQIWDTAGQERFSSLSAAFFRGADAVVLMFDIHQDETLDALHKWWGEFCEGLPLLEEDMLEYPCFVVGNKIDLVADGVHQETRVSGHRIQQFLAELVPYDASPPHTDTNGTTPASSPIIPVRKSPSIDIGPRISPVEETRPKSPDQDQVRSHSLSNHNNNNKFNTLSSINSTTTSVYLTPSSSLFSDTFHTAHSSPEQSSSSSVTNPSGSTSIVQARMSTTTRQRRLTSLSTGSASSESATTITPSLFARSKQGNMNGGENNSSGTTSTTPSEGGYTPNLSDSDENAPRSSGGGRRPSLPPLPERRPSLHFTSAKTGEGVRELFEHVAERVMRRLEYEEYFEARRMHYREASGAETVRLGMGVGARVQQQSRGRFERCCA